MEDSIKYPKIHFINCTEEEMDEYVKLADEGNTQAKLNIILHNQGVINQKLTELLNGREEITGSGEPLKINIQ